QVGIDGVRRLAFEPCLIKTGRQGIDQVNVARELAVFLARHATRNKYPEMTDLLVHRVDDCLPAGADVVYALVKVQYPSERLRLRRDVIGLGAEYDDRRLDVAQIEHSAI